MGDIVEHLAKGIALVIRTVGIVDEIEEHLLLFEHDLLNTQLFTISAEGDNTDEFLGHLRNFAKAVFQATAISSQSSIEVVAIGEIVEFAVEQHTLGVVGDILIREVHLDIAFKGTVVDKSDVVRNTGYSRQS